MRHLHDRPTLPTTRPSLHQLRSSRTVRRAVRSRAAAAVVAGAVLVTVAQRTEAAARAERRWGDTTQVLVLRTDVPAGSTVTAAQVERRRWPTALVPPGAVRELPTAPRVRTDVGRGEVLVRQRLGRPGGGALATALERGEVAVRVPLAGPATGVVVGDRVDVVAPVSGTVDDVVGHLRVDTVAVGARVLQLGPTEAVLAVRRAEAEATTGAALGGLVALVVRS